ncbi:MAG TPA: hypothetical protein VJN43_02850 [Bryobacteraceae bacterium]|nr:hypothetical protein [Bryobacteraceae bacterium]
MRVLPAILPLVLAPGEARAADASSAMAASIARQLASVERQVGSSFFLLPPPAPLLPQAVLDSAGLAARDVSPDSGSPAPAPSGPAAPSVSSPDVPPPPAQTGGTPSAAPVVQTAPSTQTSASAQTLPSAADKTH